MAISKVFLYAEFQVAMPFDALDLAPMTKIMKSCKGLKSKTWLAGIGNQSIGGFYEFDTVENAQAYIDGVLQPSARQLGGNLSVRLFDGDIVAAGSREMNSPFYP